MAKTHYLKTWPRYFEKVQSGEKSFEVRRDDRGFEVGDRLILREFDPETDNMTGRQLHRCIGYILTGGQFGIEAGYAVLSLQPVT